MDSEYLSPDDAKHLIKFCKAGRLYDFEQWIRTGRSLKVPGELKKAALGVAVSEIASVPLLDALMTDDRRIVALFLEKEPTRSQISRSPTPSTNCAPKRLSARIWIVNAVVRNSRSS